MRNEEELLNKLLKIARIEISSKDRAGFIKKVTDLMEFSKLINETNVENEQPMFSVPEWLGKHMENLRKDIVSEEDHSIELINNSPDKEDVFIAVPKVIE